MDHESRRVHTVTWTQRANGAPEHIREARIGIRNTPEARCNRCETACASKASCESLISGSMKTRTTALNLLRLVGFRAFGAGRQEVLKTFR
jgi:hypothetical protein